MKSKVFIVFLLVMLLGVIAFVQFHLSRSKHTVTTSRISIPTLSLPGQSLVPIKVAQMRTIDGQREEIGSVTADPNSSNWPAIQLIVSTEARYEDRLQAVQSLRSPLTEADWDALHAFLLKADPQDKVQLNQVVKNDLLDVLCAMSPLPTGMGNTLTRMYENQQQDEVIRNYAVQHFTACYEQMAAEDANGKALQSVQDTLWKAVDEAQDSIGGTALLALKRLSQEYPNFDQKKVAAAALQMAGEANAGELSHITAYQVCAQLGQADALPIVQEAARNGESISARISAIGALGQLGGQQDIPFLRGILGGMDDRLKPAAGRALEEIQAATQTAQSNP